MSKLKIQNTLENTKEEFIPVDPSNVRIYACGPTVYDYAHIGNARMAVVNDLLVRLLRTLFPKVTYVSNITDIDDKIIEAAQTADMPFQELTLKFEAIYNEDMAALGVHRPDVQPRATDHIAEMITLTKTLVKLGHAYEKKGHVLFHVPSFEKYGCLSGRNRDEQIIGSRVEVAPFKKDPTDFILWKPSPDPLPGWDSPWGFGRPGWHLECSAMSTHHLGNHFDIHGGGMDLTFPHHENEIAQSEGANNCSFVNTWMHVGFVNINDEKMSKSLNNFFTIRDVLEKYDGETLRYFLISSHYRSPLNFSDENLTSAESALTRLYTAIRGLSASTKAMNQVSMHFDYEKRFNEALDDDFNTPIALSILFEIAKHANTEREDDKDQAGALSELLKKLGNHIGIMGYDAEDYLKMGIEFSDSKIDEKIRQRESARASKDFAMSDQIRDELLALGIILEDSINGTTWRRK